MQNLILRAIFLSAISLMFSTFTSSAQDDATQNDSGGGGAGGAVDGIKDCSQLKLSPANIGLTLNCSKLREKGGYKNQESLDRVTYTVYEYNLDQPASNGSLVVSFYSKNAWYSPYELQSFIRLHHSYGKKWERTMYVKGDELSHAITINLNQYDIKYLKKIEILLSENSDFEMDEGNPKAPEVLLVQ